jgi:hypothetical protein
MGETGGAGRSLAFRFPVYDDWILKMAVVYG